MKYNALLFFSFFFGCMQIHAQTDTSGRKQIDSLKKELISAKLDTVRVDIYLNLGEIYSEVKQDSSIFYLKKAEILSKKNNLKLKRIDILSGLAYDYMIKKEFSKSLEYYLKVETLLNEKGLEKFVPADLNKLYNKQTNDQIIEISKANNLKDSGHLYGAVGNKKKQLANYLEAQKIYEKYNLPVPLGMVRMNLGVGYVENNKFGKAKLSLESSLQLLTKYNYQKYLGSVWEGLGIIYFHEKNYEKANECFRKGIESSTENGNMRSFIYLLDSQTHFYFKTKKYDSSFIAAKSLIKNSITYNLPNETATGYQLLSKNFAIKKNSDSAYFYAEKAMTLQDSLTFFNKKSIDEFQNKLLDENLKNRNLESENIAKQNQRNLILLLSALGIFSLIIFLLYRNNKQKQKSNLVLNTTLSDLKATQSQLIQSEKMASLGELTAGIAHEIQNPLNFVNNFSEVSNEMIQEIKEERKKSKEDRDESLENELLEDISNNLEKINHHGKRADAIVKGMLQHSRIGSGKKELTDINALADEYLRLAYHGLRAKDKNFNAELVTNFDETLPKINVVPQDIGRVLLNLFTNAFYATNQKQKINETAYRPIVEVSIFQQENTIEIVVKDNGIGIPEAIKDKILQPFFTTKPTGEGTGLGLSLSYDIVKAHGGEIKVESTENEGTKFIIILKLH